MRCVRFSLPSAMLLFTVLASICTAGADEVPWPAWRGPDRDGKSPDKGLLKSWPAEGPKQLWKVTGIGQGFSNVSFGGGLIYITGRKEAGNPSTLPEAKHVYERPGKRLYLFAIDMQGKYKWVRDLTASYMGYYKGARATPTYDNGNLYLVTGTGVIGCYDAKTGETKWTRNMAEFNAKPIKWGFTESVLIVGDLMVISPGGDSFMVALDKATGKTVWQSEEYGGAQYGSPIHVVYQDIPMVINGSHKGLMAVHAETGKTLWTQPFGADALACVPTVAFSDGYVFWAVGYGEGAICMKMSVSGEKVTATEAWRTKGMDCHVGGYVIQDGYIYGNHKNGYTCLELKTGEKKWFDKGIGKGSLCWADGMLYLYNEKDGTAALATCSPDGLEIKGTFSVLGECQSWAHPVVVGGRLYLRYDDNLYCFDVTKSDRPAETASGKVGRGQRLLNVGYVSEKHQETITNEVLETWERQYQELANGIRNGGQRSSLPKVLDRHSLILPSDHSPLDCVIRRTGALLEHLKNLPHAPNLKDYQQGLSEIKKEHSSGGPEKELYIEACKLRRAAATKGVTSLTRNDPP